MSIAECTTGRWKLRFRDIHQSCLLFSPQSDEGNRYAIHNTALRAPLGVRNEEDEDTEKEKCAIGWQETLWHVSPFFSSQRQFVNLTIYFLFTDNKIIFHGGGYNNYVSDGSICLKCFTVPKIQCFFLRFNNVNSIEYNIIFKQVLLFFGNNHVTFFSDCTVKFREMFIYFRTDVIIFTKVVLNIFKYK